MTTAAKEVDRLLELLRTAESPEARSEAEDALTAVVSSLEHTYIGPTWARNEDGSWALPEHTLGWEIAGWCSTYLRTDDSTEDDEIPWKFTKEQLRFLLWWYAVDEHGDFVYRTGVLQRLKGWGKDPLLAVISTVEFVGPCRFAGWDEDGNPLARPHPNSWIQIAAVSKDQTRNTVKMFAAIWTKDLIETYGIQPGNEIIRASAGRQVIEAVTSNYKSLEGGRATFVVLNETQWWTSGTGGHEMYEVVDGNVTKSKGGTARYLAICNAYVPGQDSVGERMRHAHQLREEGKAVDVKALYDTIEAHPATPLIPLALRIVIPIIRGDAWWLNPETIIGSIQNTSLSISGSRRKWLNQIVAAEDALYTEDQVDANEVETFLVPGTQIVMGFDGGKSDDSTAIVGIRIADGVAFPLAVWEKPEENDGWQVDKEVVDSKVNELHQTYAVLGFYADVALWDSYIAKWGKAHAEGYAVRAKGATGDPIAWDMRQSEKTITLAHERLVAAVVNGQAKWSMQNDIKLGKRFRRHVLNTFRHTNNYGLLFRKESRESKRKVDLYAAWMLAYECLNDYRLKGKKEEPTSQRVWFMR